ncbi:hypothetical protein CEUSTIGMA_g11044.t1 [Chlamydomonas eustigma]|uniref:Uncharacterized protein n=1 Tax=Chlamydomonas eustigma TaxID=1157962 RepID=A0A250XLF9_9CHLO|nr:hypothetical protein CEUSTIGMA_g11044.t1 [Chlamydomonas eustigma]|eukprot:GAX83620.1 hypothetical protein CEUSTIGMA_g11044.t1 [Chlamydomonas eustigma]
MRHDVINTVHKSEDQPNPIIAAWVSSGPHFQDISYLKAASLSNQYLVREESSSLSKHFLSKEFIEAERGTKFNTQSINTSQVASSSKPSFACIKPYKSGLEHCKQVVLKYYLELVQTQAIRQREQAAVEEVMDKPKGLTSLFVLFCPSLDLLDDLAALLARCFVKVSPTVASLSWILVLPMLWAVRHLLIHGHIALGVSIATFSIFILMLAEHVATASAIHAAKISLGTPDRRKTQHIVSSSSPRAMAYYLSPVGQSGHKDVANATAAGVNSASSSKASSSKPAGKPEVDPVLKAVRQSVIKLEGELYGNEVTEGLLPLEALPSRVQKICEDLGIPAVKHGAAMSEVLKALQRAEAEVGI